MLLPFAENVGTNGYPQQQHMKTEKINPVLNKILKTITRKLLSIEEIVVLYGNLGYWLGASLSNETSLININELIRRYNEKPTIATALMITGLTVISWVNEVEKHSSFDRQNVSVKLDK